MEETLDLGTEYLQGLDLINSFNYKIERMLPSEFAEKNRVMTSDVSNFVGKFKYKRNEYFREIVDHLAPESDARVIAFIKAAQIGASASVIENGMAYIISQNPGNTWITCGHEGLIPKAMARIDQSIDSCGLRHLIRPNASRRKTQATGDTNTSKEFALGSLMLSSANNHKKIRQVSMQYGFIDDYEAIKNSSKESGSTIDMIMQRFASGMDKMKLYLISTPELDHNSNIQTAFLLGDQRYYFVDCGHCGNPITFEWETKGHDGKRAGIIWQVDDDGKLIKGTVRHKCKHCGHEIEEKEKFDLIPKGQWIATGEASRDGYYSYHINALYAAAGMFGWTHYVEQYIEATPKGRPVNRKKLQTFYNLVLGKTWKDQGESPKSMQLMRNMGRYEQGVIPSQLSMDDGNGRIVMITCGSDLNGTLDDARLDYEVVAWAENGTSYSITHGSVGTFIPRENTLKNKIERDKWTYKKGYPNSVWPVFKEIIDQVYYDQHGKECYIMATAVDTGFHTIYAKQFINEVNLPVFGVKGKDEFKGYRLDTDKMPFKKEVADNSGKFYLFEVNRLKDIVAELMKLQWEPDEDVQQPAGLMNFPQPVDGKYGLKNFFDHYQAEHRIIEKDSSDNAVGVVWEKKKQTAQNHLFDCRIYNYGLRDLFAYLMCKEYKIKEPSFDAYVQLITRQMESAGN